jgi:hypothetical protein
LQDSIILAIILFQECYILLSTNYYYVFTANDTPLYRLVTSQTDPAQSSNSTSPSSGPSSYRKHNSQNVTTVSALGWSFLVQQPFLPQFSEHSGSIAAVDDNSTRFDFFSIFFREFIIKCIKTETKRYAKSVEDKLSRTIKLSLKGQTCTGVRLHEMYLFFAAIIHMCKLRDCWSKCNFISINFQDQ